MTAMTWQAGSIDHQEAVEMKTVLNVKGMKCSGCEATVRDAVESCKGVISSVANFKENTVEIEYEEDKADLEAIRRAISAKGYQVD